MTFFYNLNKKLDEIRATPELTHKQLNERDMSRAAKGYEKYGKEGMEALAKAGREGKALDPVRKKYDKYDEGIEDRIGDLDPTNPVNIPAYQRKAAAQGGNKASKPPIIGNRREGYPRMSGGAPVPEMPKSREGYPRFSGGGGYTGKGVKEEGSAAMTPKQKSFAKLAPPADKITFADKIAGAKKEVDEMLGDVAAEAMKNALSGGQKKLDKNNNGKLDANDFEMLRKGAGKLGSKAPQAKVSQHSTLKPHSNPKSGLSGQVPSNKQETDEGWDDMMKDAERRRNAPKIGSITHGSKHDVEEIPGGRRVTRRVDPNTGHSVGADDDTPADGEKRGRGRPKGTKAAIGAKGPSGKSKLMAKEGAGPDDIAVLERLMDEAFADGNNALGNALQGVLEKMDGGEKQVDEKAVSKKQQRFMGMVHATQKGEKAPSKEVAKVAKSMGKKDAEDFAATKHKGLPEKKKSADKDDSKSDAPKKKKEKTEEAGGTGTPTASSGFGFGKGIYDSLNRELESMIAEGMNVNMSMNTDANGGPSKSLTVTATDDDAMKLGKLLKMAGLGDGSESGYGGSGYQSACGCGTPDCSCGGQEMDEAYGDNAVSQNEPDYPTNTETSDDALQYSGGLNKPKSTGQSTVPVLASQEERQESYAEAEEDALHRMMEMAGQPASGKEDLARRIYKLASLLHTQDRMYAQDDPKSQAELNQLQAQFTQQYPGEDAFELGGKVDRARGQDERQSAAQAATLQKARQGIGGMYEAEESQHDTADADLKRMREMAGIKEAKKVDEDDMEEGNKFTGNLAKARAAGKKEADLDGDGTMEKVDEGILAATADLWKEYKGQYGV